MIISPQRLSVLRCMKSEVQSEDFLDIVIIDSTKHGDKMEIKPEKEYHKKQNYVVLHF